MRKLFVAVSIHFGHLPFHCSFAVGSSYMHITQQNGRGWPSCEELCGGRVEGFAWGDWPSLFEGETSSERMGNGEPDGSENRSAISVVFVMPLAKNECWLSPESSEWLSLCAGPPGVHLCLPSFEEGSPLMCVSHFSRTCITFVSHPFLLQFYCCMARAQSSTAIP